MSNFHLKYKNFLKESIVAIITPMKQDGKIDYISLKRIIKYHILNGTKSIVCCSTTGEGILLNNFEKMNLLLKITEYSDKKIPIILGVVENTAKNVIDFIKYFKSIDISACLIATPKYIKLSQKSLYYYFKSISEEIDLPQILYNVPDRTGNDLLPKTIAKLSNLNNIIAIKESSGDLLRVKYIKRLVKKDFILLCGNDLVALDFIKLGGHGMISVIANIAANLISKMCKFALNGKYSAAEKLEDIIFKLNSKLYIEPNPVPIKWAAYYLKLINFYQVRLPMLSLDKNNCILLKKELKNKNLLKFEIFN